MNNDQLPHSPSSERALIGSILINPDMLGKIPPVDPADFHLEDHKWIWQTILELKERGDPIDYTTVCTHLDGRGKLKDIGGAAVVTRLINETPNSFNAPGYASTIKARAQQRKAVLIAQRLATAANDQEGDISLALLSAKEALDELVNTTGKGLEAFKTTWSTMELLTTVFPESKWAVPDLIPVGLSSLAGRPKLGKSWLALQIAHAVGTGGMVFNKKVELGKVLYLALEDSPKRLNNRMIKQGFTGCENITWTTTWKAFPEGGLAALQAEITNGKYSLVVVDTLSRALGRSDQLKLEEMTLVIGNLQHIALSNDVAILTVDHHRKSSGFESNPTDDILGSTAKSAVIDGILGLYRETGKHEATLKVTGRDIEEQELALEWDPLTWCWQSLGTASDVREDTLKGDILQAVRELKEDGQLATSTTVAKLLKKDKSLIGKMLRELAATGKLIQLDKIGREVPYGSL